MMLYHPKDGQLSAADEPAGAPQATVIRFATRASTVGLSLRDRMEVANWRGTLQVHGYDRMVIHERIAGDPPEVESFLSIYRRGEAWARWGLARCGASILAWCSVTGADLGRFPSVEDALLALCPAAPGPQVRHPSAEVIRAFC